MNINDFNNPPTELGTAAQRLLAAFNKGGIEGTNPSMWANMRIPPTQAEIYRKCEELLAKEAKDGHIRQEAIQRLMDIDKAVKGKPFSSYMNPGNLPDYLDEYSWTGGDLFFYDTKVSLEEALTECIKDGYIDFMTNNR